MYTHTHKHTHITHTHACTPVSVLGATGGGTGDTTLGAALGGRFGALVRLSPGFGLSSAPLVNIVSRFSYI